MYLLLDNQAISYLLGGGLQMNGKKTKNSHAKKY
jgi:hypothetical protein